MIKKVLFIVLCLVIVLASGCGKEPSVGETTPPDTVEPLPPAMEIDRGGEEYDYTGWANEMIDPEIGMSVRGDWVSNSSAGDWGSNSSAGDLGSNSMEIASATKWTDPNNSDAKLFYQNVYSEKAITPHEGIWKEYGSIIERGGDVEYGVFNSKYLADAYYVRYVEKGYVYIALYFIFFTQYGSEYGQVVDSLIPPRILFYENKVNTGDGEGEGTLTEDAFWKAAQSIYIAKNYEAYNDNNWENPRPVPYIPAVDGPYVWEGGGQGIVPEEQ